MKNLFAIAVMLFVTVNLFGQRPNIKSFKIPVQYATLPYNFVEADLRTFSVDGPNTDDITLYGWEYKEEGGTVVLKNYSRRFTVGESKLEKNVTEKKDKEGNVKKTTTYFVKSESKGTWRCSINGPRNELLSEKQKARLAEKKAKEEEKKKAKGKDTEEEANPFLTGVEVDEEAEAQETREGYKTYYYTETRTYNYQTGKKKTSVLATDTYRREIDMQVDGFKEELADDMNSTAKRKINNAYGYAPRKVTTNFKVVGAKKHPEFKDYQNAMSALKVILGKMRFNAPLDDIKKDAAPVINYLEGLTTKYTEDKKQAQKVRTTAFYNLAQYYYYTDQPEKCKEYAQQLIDLKLDKRNGKRFITLADDLIKQLAHHKMESRHLILEIDESSLEIEEEVEEDTDAGN